MGLFGFGKKKESEVSESAAAEVPAPSQEGILVLGGGCAKCNELEAETVAALQVLGSEEAVGHITDFAVIATYGVMSTPALVVDGKVVVMGKVAKSAEIVELIQKTRG